MTYPGPVLAGHSASSRVFACFVGRTEHAGAAGPRPRACSASALAGLASEGSGRNSSACWTELGHCHPPRPCWRAARAASRLAVQAVRGATGALTWSTAFVVGTAIRPPSGRIFPRRGGSELSLLFWPMGRRAEVIGISRPAAARRRRSSDTPTQEPWSNQRSGCVCPALFAMRCRRFIEHTPDWSAATASTFSVGRDDRPAVLRDQPSPVGRLWKLCTTVIGPTGLFREHTCMTACAGDLPLARARAPQGRAGPLDLLARARPAACGQHGFPAWCSDIPRPAATLRSIAGLYRARRKHVCTDARAGTAAVDPRRRQTRASAHL